MAKSIIDLLNNAFGGTSADRAALGAPPEWGQRADRYPVKTRSLARLPITGPKPSGKPKQKRIISSVPTPKPRPPNPLPLWGPRVTPRERDSYPGQERYGSGPQTFAGNDRYSPLPPTPETYAGQERYGSGPQTFAGNDRYGSGPQTFAGNDRYGSGPQTFAGNDRYSSPTTPETYAGQERYGSGPQTYAGNDRYQPYPTIAQDQGRGPPYPTIGQDQGRGPPDYPTIAQDQGQEPPYTDRAPLKSFGDFFDPGHQGMQRPQYMPAPEVNHPSGGIMNILRQLFATQRG